MSQNNIFGIIWFTKKEVLVKKNIYATTFPWQTSKQWVLIKERKSIMRFSSIDFMICNVTLHSNGIIHS